MIKAKVKMFNEDYPFSLEKEINEFLETIDPKNKSAIINFLQDKWVKKDDIELIIDDSMRRDRKLQQILG
jgi:hypothetical protein